MGKRERKRARAQKKARARRDVGKKDEAGRTLPRGRGGKGAARMRGVQYTLAQSILVVGDGDFSFSEGLAAHRGGGAGILATSLDSRTKVIAKYPGSEARLARLASRGVSVRHKVDATQLGKCLRRVERPEGGYHRIVFNFPHSGLWRCPPGGAIPHEFGDA